MFETTALYAGALALWLLFLAFQVIRQRRAAKVSLGDGGDAALARCIRAHGNAAETVPIALILLGLAEGMGTPAWVLHALGATLLAGRVLHGLHFLKADGPGAMRFLGMVLTVAMIGLTAVGLIGHALIGGAA